MSGWVEGNAGEEMICVECSGGRAEGGGTLHRMLQGAQAVRRGCVRMDESRLTGEEPWGDQCG